MKHALLLLAAGLIVPAPLVDLPASLYTTTITVRLADPVDRRVFGLGVKPEQFYFSFKTVYRIRGELVRPAEFWRVPLRGRVLQVKAVRNAGFWFATAANVKE
ncbi:hypothetical protein [Deinococcus aquatilis]|uniref:hypothetical protein n=1 Tax=Deinococcus aquatilis TaxID=519440 RepID=UPI00035CB4C4|nr:hypothetical protein [Deinococcus aquatilis]